MDWIVLHFVLTDPLPIFGKGFTGSAYIWLFSAKVLFATFESSIRVHKPSRLAMFIEFAEQSEVLKLLEEKSIQQLVKRCCVWRYGIVVS